MLHDLGGCPVEVHEALSPAYVPQIDHFPFFHPAFLCSVAASANLFPRLNILHLRVVLEMAARKEQSK